MRFLLALGLLFFCLTPVAQAREVWEGGLPERMFKAFLQIYQQDPSAMARFAGGLRNVSSAQTEETLQYLGVTHFTYLYPMIIHGSDIPDLIGTANQRLSLMAARGPSNHMVPIPFQIDEFDKNGLIWIDGYNSAKPAGKPGIWDSFDQLVFMYRDAGQKRYDPAHDGSVAGRIIKEIELTSPRDPPRWVYLMEDNPERSDASYVATNLRKGEVDTTLYTFKYTPGSLIDIQSISPNAGPRAGNNVFDGLRVHLSTGILNQHLRINLDKSNIHVSPIAVKEGPIRNIMLVKARIWYFGLPTFLDQNLNVVFYEQGISVPVRVAIDSMPALRFFLLFLREPRGEISATFNNLNGAQTTFASVYDKQQMGLVDGRMDPFENRMDSARLCGNWLFMDSNQGWQMFFSNHIPVVAGGIANDFMQDVNMHMIYQDTPLPAVDGRPPGSQLTLGFTAAGIPQTVVRLLGALPSVNFNKMDSLGQVIVALGDAGQRGKLKKIDNIINTRMRELMQAGTITSVPQLADAVITDIDRLHFVGISRDVLDQLIRDALISTVKSPDQIDNNLVLQKFFALAKARGINILDLDYAVMNNAFWMPDWVGAGGPTDFDWQVNHPPVFVIHNDPSPPNNVMPHATTP